MREIGAQELVELALSRLAGGSPAELARILRRRELSDAADVSRPIPRWRDGKDEPRYRDTIRLLEALGAIRWEVLSDRPGSPEDPESVRRRIAEMRAHAAELEAELRDEERGRPRRGKSA